MNTPRNPALGTRLSGRMLAVSVSEITDLDQLGLPSDQADRALGALLLPLVSEGARVAYGGSLQAEENFTLKLSKILGEAYRRHDMEPGHRPFVQYLAGQFVPDDAGAALETHLALLHPYGEVRLITGTGARGVLSCIDDTKGQEQFSFQYDGGQAFLKAGQLVDALESRLHLVSQRQGDSLIQIRRAMNEDCNARIVVGGKKTGFVGDIPGIIQEALLSLEASKPLLVLGGFGGCSRDLAVALGLLEPHDSVPRSPQADEERYVNGLTQAGLHREKLREIFGYERKELLATLARTDSLPAATDALVKLVMPMIGNDKSHPPRWRGLTSLSRNP